VIAGALVVAAGYVLGSLPFGYWIGRLRGIDLREHGSGNTGATNALRVLGLRLGVGVLALDVGKGAAAALLGEAVGGDGLGVLAGVAAVVGHAFPVFLGFGGGKGVATAAGVMFALVPFIGLAVLLLWAVVIAATRYVSVGSMVAGVAFPLLTLAFDQAWPVTAFALFAAAMILWRHRANIARLRLGTEHRVDLRRVARALAP
jgi:glycerol-3-phosphate acyltransferase PlsY